MRSVVVVVEQQVPWTLSLWLCSPQPLKPQESPHWKWTLGEKSLAAPGTKTCISITPGFFSRTLYQPPYSEWTACHTSLILSNSYLLSSLLLSVLQINSHIIYSLWAIYKYIYIYICSVISINQFWNIKQWKPCFHWSAPTFQSPALPQGQLKSWEDTGCPGYCTQTTQGRHGCGGPRIQSPSKTWWVSELAPLWFIKYSVSEVTPLLLSHTLDSELTPLLLLSYARSLNWNLCYCWVMLWVWIETLATTELCSVSELKPCY